MAHLAAIPEVGHRRWMLALLSRTAHWSSGGRRAHCVMCGTRVCREDAISLLPRGISHAECALVHMLETDESNNPDHSRDGKAPLPLRPRLPGAQVTAMIQALVDHDSDEHSH